MKASWGPYPGGRVGPGGHGVGIPHLSSRSEEAPPDAVRLAAS